MRSSATLGCMSTYTAYDSMKDDWQYTEEVLEGSYAYGPDRDSALLPVAPTEGVRIRLGNPTQNQIAVAASTAIGYEVTDRVATIWHNTLRTDPADGYSDPIVPEQGDSITVDGVTWIIAWAKATVSGTQWLCYVRRSQTGS